MSKYLSPKLETVTPYTPGEQPQDQQYIKLNTNESPYLPSPAVVAAVSEHEVEKLRLYSDPACTDLLKTAAAQKYGDQCVVLSADVKRVNGQFRVFAKGGREDTGRDALDWISWCVAHGAGLAAGIFHQKLLTIHDLKTYLNENGVEMRL